MKKDSISREFWKEEIVRIFNRRFVTEIRIQVNDYPDHIHRLAEILEEIYGALYSGDPPKIAEFLLTALATARHAESAIGDLNERFADECQKLGRDRAVRLYWARTLRSLWPLLWRAMGKAVKWGAVIAALRRLF
jgi:hypothetical protein